MSAAMVLHAAPRAVLTVPLPPYRACELCTHGTGATLLCKHPSAAWHGQPAAVDQVRSRHGVCGPEAHLLDFPGLNA